MKEKIELAIAQNKMATALERVIIGFSGGADSSALLHYFKDRAKEVVCVHINHMIRAQEADRDESFCRSMCEKYGIELVVHRIDIPALSSARGTGLEQTARDERYRVFYEELSKRSFDSILTAHNANDNTESVIFNLVRGSGANGISGIKPKNGKILRPLILATREEILTYCAENGIEYVTDSTNANTEYTRNFIRHKIVPMLSELNPSLHTAVSRMSAALREDESLISAMAETFVLEHCADDKIDREAFNSCHDSIKVRALKRVSGENLDSKSLESAIELARVGKTGSLVNLCKGVSLKCEGSYLSFVKTSELARIEFEHTLAAGLNEIPKIGLTIAYMTDEAPSGKELIQVLRLKNISGALIVRSRREGDTISHGKMTKKLKKLLCERKIPSHLRDRVPIICDSRGIVAIAGVAVRDGSIGKDCDIILKLYK